MSRVVVVKYNATYSGRSEEVYRRLLISGLCLLTDEMSHKDALRTLLPSGAVGMKTSCIARKRNSTPVPLVEALSKLISA